MLFIRTIVSKKELRAGTFRKREHLLYYITFILDDHGYHNLRNNYKEKNMKFKFYQFQKKQLLVMYQGH